MRADPRVFLMGEDIGLHGGIFRVTKDLFQEFGHERVRDTPISESGFVGLGIGAAIAGMRPVVELLFMDFALVAADQIVNQAAKLRYMAGGTVSVPLVIRTQQGGGRGNGAQHSQSFEILDGAGARADRDHPGNARGCEGTAQERDPRGQPGRVHRA